MTHIVRKITKIPVKIGKFANIAEKIKNGKTIPNRQSKTIINQPILTAKAAKSSIIPNTIHTINIIPNKISNILSPLF